MSTHNIGFYEDLTKIIFELSSNTHLISSAKMSNLTTTPCRLLIPSTELKSTCRNNYIGYLLFQG